MSDAWAIVCGGLAGGLAANVIPLLGKWLAWRFWCGKCARTRWNRTGVYEGTNWRACPKCLTGWGWK